MSAETDKQAAERKQRDLKIVTDRIEAAAAKAESDLATALAPVSLATPAGPNLREDEAFAAVVRSSAGKPETQWSKAEEPNWSEVGNGCAKLLAKTKDLELGVILSFARLRVHGFAGLAAGLAVVGGLVDQFWDGLTPPLDPEDGDAAERLNYLGEMSARIGARGDRFGFVRQVMVTPLVDLPGLGKHAQRDVEAARNAAAAAAAEGKPAPTPAPVDIRIIDASLKDAPPVWLEHQRDAAAAAAAATLNIERAVAERSAGKFAVDLGVLRAALESVHATVAPFCPGPAPDPADADDKADEEAKRDAPGDKAKKPGPSVPGEIRSPADVTAALDRICRYYAEQEPSSPVPLLLLRAKRLVSKSFAEVVGDLSPDALATLSVLSGTDLNAELAAASSQKAD
jgi:type VI secretion system protein ImpA